MRSIIARLLFLVALAAPAAHAQSYKKPVVSNRTRFNASVTVNYASCRSDSFRISGVLPSPTRPVGEGNTGTSGSNRGLCLIRSVNVALDGADKPVRNYTSSGTSYHRFYIVDKGDHYAVLSEGSAGVAQAKAAHTAEKVTYKEPERGPEQGPDKAKERVNERLARDAEATARAAKASPVTCKDGSKSAAGPGACAGHGGIAG